MFKDLRFQLCAFWTNFFETGRDDDSPFYAGFDAFFDNTWNGRGRGNDDSQVDLIGQLFDIGIGSNAQDVLALGIDRINGAPKGTADQGSAHCRPR